MAYNPFGAETGLEDFSGGMLTEEEKKRRQRMLGMATGQQSFTDVAQQYLGQYNASCYALFLLTYYQRVYWMT